MRTVSSLNPSLEKCLRLVMPFFDLVTLIMHPQLSELEGGDYNNIEILDSSFYPICVK